MNEAQFWKIIESSWQVVGEHANERQILTAGKLSAERAEELTQSMSEVIPDLEERLEKLSEEELLAFDRILERKLYNIDREEIHEHTDGSDDGFLYARGFIVAAGQGYYEAVNREPALAMSDLECEDMCYVSWRIYRRKFGEVPSSGISRETDDNKQGWVEQA